MHPAPSVILFTVLSGAGFGLLGLLGLGPALGAAPSGGLAALLLWGLGYALAGAGLIASGFHLGRPERALRAFSQWRSSWLSREAWATVAALLASAPVALASILGRPLPVAAGLVSGLICLATVLVTAMIYAQLKTVPRWHHWTVPALFAGFALTGGAILAGFGPFAALPALALGALMILAFRIGDGRFAAAGSTLATATGLGPAAGGGLRSFAPPHTGSNYLMREMIHVVGRRHARRLRRIAVLAGAVLPALILAALPAGILATALAAILHLAGALAQRWLFFAEAEHVVGLYYGAR
ncbi:MAG: dibenzothiophene desulfurase [Alphaproteobacteria bacterium HGW-Alphaproteobacteria-6]|nr:MAG: dibenzothiophene desulfurase [Alphaproteobacteria bacterium HGW-Alphaproteobacteria-6]